MAKNDFINCELRIINASTAFCEADWSWKNTGSRKFELNLWLVLKGCGRLETPRKTYNLCAGDCFVFRHWKPHLATYEGDNPPVIPYIVYNYLGNESKPFKPAEMSLPAFHRRIEDTSFLVGLMERSIAAFAHGAAGQAEAVHWLRSSLLEVERQDYRPDYAGLELEQFEQIEKICRQMQQRPSAVVQVEKLAEDMGYSTDHFIRVFQKFKGVTPGKFLIQCRMKTAVELLKFSSHSITRIAQLLGYGDIYAFSKQFRQKVGQSPSEYRK